MGCALVGKPCRRHYKCCSGRCKGKQAKKTCRAHHAAGCTPERSACIATTGNAGFCADFRAFDSNNCQPCRKDHECEALGFGRGSACVIVAGGFCETTYVGVNGSAGTACLPPWVVGG